MIKKIKTDQPKRKLFLRNKNRSGNVGKIAFGEHKIKINGVPYVQRIEYKRGSKEISTSILENGKSIHSTSFKLINYGGELVAEIVWPVTIDEKRGQRIYTHALRNALPVLKKAGVKRVTVHALRASQTYLELGFKPGELELPGRWYYKEI